MRLKIVRVVTAANVVPWHMHNTLLRAHNNFDVTVIGQDVSKFKDDYFGINFIDLNIDRKPNIFLDFVNLVKLCAIVYNLKPDILHSIMPKAGLLSALAGFFCRTPVRIHTFTGQTWALLTGVRRYFYFSIDKLINKLNTDCLTDSPSQSDFLFSHGISKFGRPLPVLLKGSLSGVDVIKHNKDRIKPHSKILVSNLGIQPSDFIFGYLARKTKDKGALDILTAFKSISNYIPSGCKLLFVGPDEDGLIFNLKKIAPDLFNDVIDVGHVSNPESYLSVMDVLCLPSYREGFGSIVIDAAGMGIPTIGSRIPGLTDSIIDGETGSLCSSGNLDEFKMAMLRMISDPGYLNYLGCNAKNRVDKFFTADLLYDALRDFYFTKFTEFSLKNP